MCFTTWEWWTRRWWWCFTKVTTYLFISLWKKCYGLRQQKLGHKIVCRQILWPVWTAVMVWSRVTQYCYFVNFLLLTLTNCINAHDGSHYCHVFRDNLNTNCLDVYQLMNGKKSIDITTFLPMNTIVYIFLWQCYQLMSILE